MASFLIILLLLLLLLFSVLYTANKDILKSFLERAGVTTQEENIQILSESIPADKSIFSGLETSYRRQKFYKKHFGLVVSGNYINDFGMTYT